MARSCISGFGLLCGCRPIFARIRAVVPVAWRRIPESCPANLLDRRTSGSPRPMRSFRLSVRSSGAARAIAVACSTTASAGKADSRGPAAQRVDARARFVEASTSPATVVSVLQNAKFRELSPDGVSSRARRPGRHGTTVPSKVSPVVVVGPDPLPGPARSKASASTAFPRKNRFRRRRDAVQFARKAVTLFPPRAAGSAQRLITPTIQEPPLTWPKPRNPAASPRR
jgi:hypothetical protein